MYGVLTDNDFAQVPMDIILKGNAMDCLILDCAEVEISNYNFYSWVKEATNRVLNLTGAQSYCGLLFINYVCIVQNGTPDETLDWHTPWNVLQAALPRLA